MAMTGPLAVVYGADEIVYQPLLIVAIVPLVVLAVVSHVAIALANPKEADASDERDRLIALRGERVGGYVLAVGVFGGLVLAMAELVEGATKIGLYRRGT